MVVRVSPPCGQRVLMCCVPVVLALTISVAAAAAPASAPASAPSNVALPDPTRPPDSVAAMATTASGQIPAFAEPQLQSVLIGTNGRSAIIGGQRYKLGDRVGDEKLVKISEGEVVLAGVGGRRTMALFPAVKKRVDTPVAKMPKRATERAIERSADRTSAAHAETKAGAGSSNDRGRSADLNSSRSP